MNKQLKPFMNIISKLYLLGYTKYPICLHEQEEIDVKDIVEYNDTVFMYLQTCGRSQGK
jgi:hypothetical protein